MILLGITGKKGAGKDTVGQMIASYMLGAGYIPERFGYADALKEEVAAATGGSVETINRNKHLPEVRMLLQWWGAMRRAEREDYWIIKVEEKIRAAKGTFIYITDCRFLNESSSIKQMHGFIAKVEGKIRDDSDKDITETELERIRFDFCIRNTGSMEDLKRECRWIRDFLLEREGHKEK